METETRLEKANTDYQEIMNSNLDKIDQSLLTSIYICDVTRYDNLGPYHQQFQTSK